MSQQISLPDTLVLWPWQSRRQNPYYDEVNEQSAAWFANFGTFGQKAQRTFKTNKFGLLAGLAYPYLNKGRMSQESQTPSPPYLSARQWLTPAKIIERFRTSCDLMNLFFVLDDLTDTATASEVREMSNAVMDALRNPDNPRAHGEWVCAEIARQFWVLARKSATLSSQEHFIEAFDGWLQGLTAQAEDRDKPRLRDIDSYFKLRRVTIGLKPSLTILELGIELPREVLQHPTIEKLSLLCTDLILLDNDLASYNKEQARGDDKHNIVAIAMDQLHLDVQGAMNWAAGYHASVVRQFKEVYETIPRWGGQIDLDVQTYVDGMGNWVRANVLWSFESERYFGDQSGEIMKTRTMSLLPRTRPEYVRPSEIDAAKL